MGTLSICGKPEGRAAALQVAVYASAFCSPRPCTERKQQWPMGASWLIRNRRSPSWMMVYSVPLVARLTKLLSLAKSRH